ncbi:hypothetical protein MRBLPD1_002313 [Pseudomonas brassicacearum]|uniref:hypothetical protein n=1 Tax=Pseudomonas brassicacearum TaxID=930166 RepID=UPI003465A433
MELKKGEHFPSPTHPGAMTDSHPWAFFRWIKSHSPGETFPLMACRVKHRLGSAIYPAISKLFDIELAVIQTPH